MAAYVTELGETNLNELALIRLYLLIYFNTLKNLCILRKEFS